MNQYDQIMLAVARSTKLTRGFGPERSYLCMSRFGSRYLSAENSSINRALDATLVSIGMIDSNKFWRVRHLDDGGGGDGGGDDGSEAGESSDTATVSSAEASVGGTFVLTESAWADCSATCASYLDATDGGLSSGTAGESKKIMDLGLSPESDPTSSTPTSDDRISQVVTPGTDSVPSALASSSPPATPSSNAFGSETKDTAGSVWQSATDTASEAVDAGANYIDYTKDSSKDIQRIGKALGLIGLGFSAYDAYKAADSPYSFLTEFGKNEVSGYAASIVGGIASVATKSPSIGAATAFAAGVAFDYAGDALAAVDKFAEEQIGKTIKSIEEEIYRQYGMQQYLH